MPPALAIGAGLVASAGSGIAGSIIGANAQNNATNTAAGLAQQGAAGISSVDIPTIQSQVLQLQQIQNAGQLTPEQEQTLQQGQSVLNSYQKSQPAMQAQMQALAQLQAISKAGGLTPTDMAQLNQAMTQVNNQEQSNRNAITQQYAQRGMAGSGTQLASELAGNQAATQAASTQGFNVAAQAQQRALQAIQGAGQLGQGIETQNFGEAQGQAAAQNAINQFNTANAQNVQGQNVARTNYAQQYNLANQQSMNNANTGIANQQDIYNTGLQQQNFNNEMAKTGAVANALNKQGTIAQTGGQQQAALASGLGQAGAQAGTALANYGTSANNAANNQNNSTSTNSTSTNSTSGTQTLQDQANNTYFG